MSTAVEDAMNAALADVDTTPEETNRPTAVGGPETGPLTVKQAEKLVKTAIRSAVTFADVMHEIVKRKAWEPLGYDGPREMMRDRFTGQLVNPGTGKPYSRSQVSRMANTAWVLWSLSEALGADPSTLKIATDVLEKIPAGFNGRSHAELVDNILDEVSRRGATTASEVQEVIDETMQASKEAGHVVDAPQRDVTPAEGEATREGTDDADGDIDSVGEEETVRDSAPTSGASTGGGERYGAAGDDEEDWQDHAPGTKGSSATEAFDGDYNPGDQAPEPSMSMADALGQMRKTEKVTNDVSTLTGFPKQLQDAAQSIVEASPAFLDTVKATVDAAKAARDTAKVKSAAGLFDDLDEQELESLRDQVENSMRALPVVEAAAVVLGNLDDGEELPGVGSLTEAAAAADSAAEALSTLNEFLDEIEFAADGF